MIQIPEHSSTPNPIAFELLRRTRTTFMLALVYLLSQFYLIPVAAIGPSWALWPRIADLIFFAMIASFILGGHSSQLRTVQQRALFYVLCLICIYASLSALAYQSFVGIKIGIYDGQYIIARIGQCTALFWIFASVPLDERRRRILSTVCGFTLILIGLSVLLTYTTVIPLGAITAHLPQDPAVSGPWASFKDMDQYDFVSKGWGTLSYNHSYTGLQVILLLGLRLHLTGKQSSIANSLLMLLAVATVVMSESRAGLVALVLLCLSQLIQNPRILALAIPCTIIGMSTFNVDLLGSTLKRHQTIFSATEGDNLSGRPAIWRAHIKELNNHPLRWLIGGGTGSTRAAPHGSNAHNMFLQIVIEFGLIGLAVFMSLMCWLLYWFYRLEDGARPMFWTTIVLLITCLSQETLYPVPSLPHFLGLYLFSVAITLSYRMRLPSYRANSGQAQLY